MNEMELLRELAQQTPLPAPAELDAARARLLAAITTDPATYATALAEVTIGQLDPPAGQLRPPAPVLSAAKFMYGGAISSAALLIAALPFIGDTHGKVLGHRLTPTLTITLGTVSRPGPDRPVAVDGAGDQPGQELGAHPVHGAVRPRDAGAAVGAGGDRQRWRRAGALRRTDLAVRPRRGMDALAPGLQRVLQVGQGGAVAAAVANSRSLTAPTRSRQAMPGFPAKPPSAWPGSTGRRRPLDPHGLPPSSSAIASSCETAPGYLQLVGEG